MIYMIYIIIIIDDVFEMNIKKTNYQTNKQTKTL